jgi:hypothetical protein
LNANRPTFTPKSSGVEHKSPSIISKVGECYEDIIIKISKIIERDVKYYPCKSKLKKIIR